MTTPLPREQFPVARRWRYLNHAGVAAIPAAAADAMASQAMAAALDGGEATARFEAREAEVRDAAARLLGGHPDEVAFVKNTTEGLAYVAEGLSWSPGDRVVVPECEFPSNLYPWLGLRERGVEVVTVAPEGPAQRLPLERFEAVLAEGSVRLVACSWVQYARGWKLDLEALARLCHDHGALLCADVIQGAGVIPAELASWGVDFAAADAHKWMLGPEGCGVLWVRAEHLTNLRVLEPGWRSVAHRGQYDNPDPTPDTTARRFEGGTANFAGQAGMGAALDLILAAGVPAIWAHVDALCARLAEALEDAGIAVLTDRSAGGASGIVVFRPPDGDAVATAARLRDGGFAVRDRAGGVRVSPHGYNTEDEIDALVAAVRS